MPSSCPLHLCRHRTAAPDCNRVCSTDSHNRRWPCARVHLATSRAVVTTSGSNLLVVVVRSAFQRDGNVYTPPPAPPHHVQRAASLAEIVHVFSLYLSIVFLEELCRKSIKNVTHVFQGGTSFYLCGPVHLWADRMHPNEPSII